MAVARLRNQVPTTRMAAVMFLVGWAILFVVLWAWSAIAPPVGIG